MKEQCDERKKRNYHCQMREVYKLIQPNAMGIPVDYVWRDGRSLCHECNKKEAKKCAHV